MGQCCSSPDTSDKYAVGKTPQPGWHQQYQPAQPPPQAPSGPLVQAKQQLPNGGRAAPKAGGRPSALVTAASVHPPGTHHEVLWFPDAALPCRQVNQAGGCHRGNNCTYSHVPTSLSRFLDVLRCAERTLDVCVYNITLDEIADLVISIHKGGRVRVRCITDQEQISSNGSDIVRFRQAGIEVRTNANERGAPKGGGAANGAKGHGGGGGGYAPLLHHKFCLVDGKLLLNGSFNWSRMAVLSNHENVVIQDAPFLVSEFGREFERMWQKFSSA